MGGVYLLHQVGLSSYAIAGGDKWCRRDLGSVSTLATPLTGVWGHVCRHPPLVSTSCVIGIAPVCYGNLVLDVTCLGAVW